MWKYLLFFANAVKIHRLDFGILEPCELAQSISNLFICRWAKIYVIVLFHDTWTHYLLCWPVRVPQTGGGNALSDREWGLSTVKASPIPPHSPVLDHWIMKDKLKGSIQPLDQITESTNVRWKLTRHGSKQNPRRGLKIKPKTFVSREKMESNYDLANLAGHTNLIWQISKRKRRWKFE